MAFIGDSMSVSDSGSDSDASDFSVLHGGDPEDSDDDGDAPQVRPAWAEEAKGDASEDEGEEGGALLPTCKLYPDTATPLFHATMRSLGCGVRRVVGSLDELTSVFNEVYSNIIASYEHRTSVLEGLRGACDLFGVSCETAVSAELVTLLHQHAVMRIMTLACALHTMLCSDEKMVLELSNQKQAHGMDIQRMRDKHRESRESLERRFSMIQQYLQTAADCILAANRHYGMVSQHVNVHTEFHQLRHNLLQGSPLLRPLKDSQSVEKKLLEAAFLLGLRRKGNLIMEPRMVMLPGSKKQLYSCSFIPVCSLNTWVEYQTGITKDRIMWEQRGIVKNLVTNLENAQTFMLPSHRVQQGVYAMANAVLDCNTTTYYFLDPTCADAVALQAQVAAAVASIQTEIATHEVELEFDAEYHGALVDLETNLDCIADDYNAQLCEAMELGGPAGVDTTTLDAQQQTQVEAAISEFNQQQRRIHGRQLHKTLWETLLEAGLGLNRQSDNDADKDGGGKAEPVTVSTEAEARELIRIAHLVKVEHEHCIAVMARNVAWLSSMFATTPPPQHLVAELFIDDMFPTAAFIEFLKPRCYSESAVEGARGYTNGYLACKWQTLETPEFARIPSHQGLDEDAQEFLYVMMGRSIFPPRVHEKWQVVLEVIGWSNTGKSIICNMLELFHRERPSRQDRSLSELKAQVGMESQSTLMTRTGRLSNVIENIFGTSMVLGGEREENRVFAVVHPDLSPSFAHNFNLGQFLSWAANEDMIHAVKFKNPIMIPPPHTAFFSNTGISYMDVNDNVNRRRLTFRFNVPVRKADTELESKIRFPLLLLKCAMAYTSLTSAFQGVGIWTRPDDGGFLPDYFFRMANMNRMENQPLRAFMNISSGNTLEFDGEYAMSLRDLQQMVKTFLENDNRRHTRIKWGTPAVSEILASFKCEVVRLETCDDMTRDRVPDALFASSAHGDWVIGVRAQAGAGGGHGGAEASMHPG